MVDLIDEIALENNYRKKVFLFKKLLFVAILITLLIVSVMIFYMLRDRQRLKVNTDMSNKLMTAISEESDEVLQEVKEAMNHNLSELAALLLAMKKDNVLEQALELDKIANNQQYQYVTNQYAKLLWLALMLDHESLQRNVGQTHAYFDSFKYESDIFFAHANIIKSLWLIQNEQFDRAKALLNRIIDGTSTPENSREEAKIILSNLENF